MRLPAEKAGFTSDFANHNTQTLVDTSDVSIIKAADENYVPITTFQDMHQAPSTGSLVWTFHVQALLLLRFRLWSFFPEFCYGQNERTLAYLHAHYKIQLGYIAHKRLFGFSEYLFFFP